MTTISRPKDTAPDAWSVLLGCQRARSGSSRVLSALELVSSLQTLSGGQGVFELQSLEELFGFVMSAMDSAGVPYMIVGSFASTYHGLPRSTQDLDIVCELDVEQSEVFLELFEAPDFYLSKPALEDAVSKRGMFNLIHIPTGWKIDFILRKNREFSRREFARRIEVELLGKRVFMSSAEDTVLAKLEWAKSSGSQRQLRDVAEILDIQGERIDRDYIQAGLKELDLEAVMDSAKGPW